MYPDLQSAFVAEASTLLILLAGAVLLYRSFREKYLVPWIAGWILYIASKSFLSIGLAHPSPNWDILANVCFAVAAGLFSLAVFYYVYQSRLIFFASWPMMAALLLGIVQVLWPAHGSVFGWGFHANAALIAFFFLPVRRFCEASLNCPTDAVTLTLRGEPS